MIKGGNLLPFKHPQQIYSTSKSELSKYHVFFIMLLICVSVCIFVDDSFPADARVEFLFSSGTQRVRGTDPSFTLFSQ